MEMFRRTKMKKMQGLPNENQRQFYWHDVNAARPPGLACASRISSGSRLQRMQPCRSGATFAVFLIMQMSGPAFAAHPLVTDDTSTQGKSKHQIEFNTDHATEGRNRSRVSALTYSYGSAGYIDLYGSIPFVLASQSGAGDISFGAKWRFMEVGRTSLALKPEISFATGNARRGLGNGRTSGSLTLLASHRHGSWAVHANLGLSALRYRFSSVRASNRQQVWRASTAVGYSFNTRWTIVADAGIARNIERGRRVNPVFALAGLIYSPAPNIDLDVGIKAGLNAPETDKQIGTGLTVRF